MNLVLSMEDLYTCIGEYEWPTTYSYSTAYSFYYNVVTGERADESQHNYVITETKNPVSCGEPGYNVFTCEHCGDSYKNYFNNCLKFCLLHDLRLVHFLKACLQVSTDITIILQLHIFLPKKVTINKGHCMLIKCSK